MENKLYLKVLFVMTLFNCSNDKKVNDSIANITVKIIDSNSQKERIGDTIVLREVENSFKTFPMRGSFKVSEKVTDNFGKANFEINRSKSYIIWSIGKNNAFASAEFDKGELKNNQEIVIKVVPPKDKKLSK
ncbi:hypothetical protein J2O08_06385 [Elizabethkingia anophelis]|uniref:hypothetical protein n=1 Tax=Elizabethkingia anophelis TaxID=1117645 RepID=UPI001625A302|nr:hypothetical protein [Elizabethkingia anophelis]MCT3924524.1 hypothetical protein [Elizabethkingia anophelis]MCT4063676.1 hypothetical protein [Elizabethkingia anophelis]MCT4109974.1 hypothetical protein [Elizabethkingia anophelis]MCT4323264.1 hypothetical protein [Elizabethkingia anophelis]MDV3957413.1 hypothetical protein [Elizabethkingia anophelis]